MYEMCVDCNRSHNSFAWKYDSNGWHCQQKSKKYEFTTEQIKQDRKKYAKDLLQPWRSGEASKEFIDAYPVQSKKYFTSKEIKGARDVWR